MIGSSASSSVVWWRLEENKLQKPGVLNAFRVAVLVGRVNRNDFAGNFIMNVKDPSQAASEG